MYNEQEKMGMEREKRPLVLLERIMLAKAVNNSVLALPNCVGMHTLWQFALPQPAI